MSRKSIYLIVSKAAKNAGITKRVSPHTLRHSFSTHLLEKGTNLKTIQLLLGHANIKTTSIYMHVAKNIITEIKSPLDDLEIDIK
jgi:site-specific recombinase XerD